MLMLIVFGIKLRVCIETYRPEEFLFMLNLKIKSMWLCLNLLNQSME